MTGLNGLPKKDDEIWEVLQLLNGDIYIYRNGFKEEADIKDVFKFNAENKKNRFTRFDKSPLMPAGFSTLRLNRAVIAAGCRVVRFLRFGNGSGTEKNIIRRVFGY